MPGPRGKLPQWWLDHTPHDTLEEQVERKKKEGTENAEREQTQQEEQGRDNECTLPERADESIAAAQQETLAAPQADNVADADSVNDRSPWRSRNYRKAVPKSVPAGPDEYESTDYNLERARLKHVENGMSQRDQRRDSANSRESISLRSPPERDLTVRTTVVETFPAQEQSLRSEPTSPISPSSSAGNSTPSSISTTTRQPRHFKTAFTGVSPFDFAMQQRAREQERREKERQARESLARHHADRVEVDRANEQKLLHMEEKRRKKEAEENLKGFKKVSMESALDKSTELKRQQLEQKRKKKEAEEQHHVYKATQ